MTSAQNVSIFANVSHADLDSHLPEMASMGWKIHTHRRSKDNDGPPVQVVAVNYCSCGCETLAVADSNGEVGQHFSQ
jgi:hypothetical protein